MNIFQNTNWNFNAADIWSAVMSIVVSVAPYLLLGLAVLYGGIVMDLVRAAIGARGNLEEMRAQMYEEKYRRRGYRYMNQNEIDAYERSIRFKPWKW